jgi:hypothetical protein
MDTVDSALWDGTPICRLHDVIREAEYVPNYAEYGQSPFMSTFRLHDMGNTGISETPLAPSLFSDCEATVPDHTLPIISA